MYAKVLTWSTILRICLEERLVYRADFALGTLLRFLPIVTQIFLWKAIFAAKTDATQIGGFAYEQLVAYYLLAMISRAFSSMPNLATTIALEIREGTIKKYLIQPIDMVGFLFLNRMAHKLVYYVVAALPFALVFFLCRGYFTGWPDAPTMAAYILSLLMAFLLGFFLEASIGMIGFWFLEVSSLLFIYQGFNFFFSGHMFPITMLPGFWRTLVELMPLQYLAYFPAAVFLGMVKGPDLVRGLVIEFIWVLFFIGFCRLAYVRGLRRYSAFGG